jgi:hypothetical protein
VAWSVVSIRSSRAILHFLGSKVTEPLSSDLTFLLLSLSSL